MIQLSNFDVALSALCILAIGILSFLLKLKNTKLLFIASLRSIIQLFLIGYFLKQIFSITRFLPLLPILCLMLLVSGHAVIQRSKYKFKNMYVMTLFTMSSSSFFTAFVMTFFIVKNSPWFAPQYFIPILGMILGNSMNGIALSIDSFLEHLKQNANWVEAQLAMGATRWEATHSVFRNSIRKGMIPIINTMSVVGLVQLPGMMTGQILAGADPVSAIKYQLVILFMIVTAILLGSILATYFTYQKFLTKDHRLDLSDLI